MPALRGNLGTLAIFRNSFALGRAVRVYFRNPWRRLVVAKHIRSTNCTMICNNVRLNNLVLVCMKHK